MTNSLDTLFDLKNKVIVITGATGLLGEKHAEAVAAFGGTPVLLDLSKDKVDRLSSKLEKKYNTSSVGFVVDVTDEEQIIENSVSLIKLFGKVDGLINNAAKNPKVESNSMENFSRLENFPLEEWNKDIAVGLTGAFLCAKHYGYEINNNPNGGSIINISSDLGLIGPDQRLYAEKELDDDKQVVKPVTYSVIKTGIIGLTRYLATYWAHNNVRCNAICPGGVNNGQPENFLKEINKRIPMGRMANCNEYQGTIIWLLSSASSYLNGAVIPIDGGRTTW